MSDVGQVERLTQRRVLRLLERRLGYRYLGEWNKRQNNRAIETAQGFSAGSPTVMFSGRYRLAGRDFDVSPDGTRFVMMRADSPRTANRIRVLLTTNSR